ncbi:hypothetical protein GCM10007390_47180 [Persicitalea jodogahamensis]|uniref:Uncharacterized protein n=2 Tax=Persicitalea jodogahamensis TaxID=402147 RepID=A0A8J3DDM0_9BACT|nr:hypothetical protein GCM10007390_47180 [Persicitalea jodogahamensis]
MCTGLPGCVNSRRDLPKGGNTEDRRGIFVPGGGKASVNGEEWIGTTSAMKHDREGLPVAKLFALAISGKTESMDEYYQQTVFVQKIPLRTGKFSLDELQKNMKANEPAAYLTLIAGGDMVFGRYYPVGLKFNSQSKDAEGPDSPNNWIQIKRYNKRTGRVTGTFEITFRGKGYQDTEIKTYRFLQGTFKANIIENNIE